MSISLIIPIYNEEDNLNRAHHHFRELNQRAELVFVDGGSSDGSVTYASQLGTVITARKGRAAQMNAGACVTHGDILLFLHADCYLGEDALSSMRQCVEQGAVGGCFTQRLTNDSPAFRRIEHEGNRRARIRKVFFGDQGIFVRRDIFQKIGGFPEVPIMEDVEIMRRIKRTGGEICILPERVKTSPRRWETEGVLYCTLRNWLLAILFAFRVPPEKLSRFFAHGRKIYQR